MSPGMAISDERIVNTLELSSVNILNGNKDIIKIQRVREFNICPNKLPNTTDLSLKIDDECLKWKTINTIVYEGDYSHQPTSIENLIRFEQLDELENLMQHNRFLSDEYLHKDIDSMSIVHLCLLHAKPDAMAVIGKTCVSLVSNAVKEKHMKNGLIETYQQEVSNVDSQISQLNVSLSSLKKSLQTLSSSILEEHQQTSQQSSTPQLDQRGTDPLLPSAFAFTPCYDIGMNMDGQLLKSNSPPSLDQAPDVSKISFAEDGHNEKINSTSLLLPCPSPTALSTSNTGDSIQITTSTAPSNIEPSLKDNALEERTILHENIKETEALISAKLQKRLELSNSILSAYDAINASEQAISTVLSLFAPAGRVPSAHLLAARMIFTAELKNVTATADAFFSCLSGLQRILKRSIPIRADIPDESLTTLLHRCCLWSVLPLINVCLKWRCMWTLHVDTRGCLPVHYSVDSSIAGTTQQVRNESLSAFKKVLVATVAYTVKRVGQLPNAASTYHALDLGTILMDGRQRLISQRAAKRGAWRASVMAVAVELLGSNRTLSADARSIAKETESVIEKLLNQARLGGFAALCAGVRVRTGNMNENEELGRSASSSFNNVNINMGHVEDVLQMARNVDNCMHDNENNINDCDTLGTNNQQTSQTMFPNVSKLLIPVPGSTPSSVVHCNHLNVNMEVVNDEFDNGCLPPSSDQQKLEGHEKEIESVVEGIELTPLAPFIKLVMHVIRATITFREKHSSSPTLLSGFALLSSPPCPTLEELINNFLEEYVTSSPFWSLVAALEMNPHRTLIITHESCSEHMSMPTFPEAADCVIANVRRSHTAAIPENPSRLEVLTHREQGILRGDFFSLNLGVVWSENPSPALDYSILAVHSETYFARLTSAVLRAQELIVQMQSSNSLNVKTPHSVNMSDDEEYNIIAQQESNLEVDNLNFNTTIPHHSTSNSFSTIAVALDDDTLVTPGSFQAARLAAGSAIEAIDAVCLGRYQRAFAAVRPPGHHMGPSGVTSSSYELNDGSTTNSQGFCLFNNVAIGAAHCRRTYGDKVKRIAVIDFDVHHGNGTEACFRNVVKREVLKSTMALGGDVTINGEGVMQVHYKPWRDETDAENLFFASVHAHDGHFYPTTGIQGSYSYPQVVNVTTCQKDSIASVRSRIRAALLSPLCAFEPDLIIISAGFDAHVSDFLNHSFGRFHDADFHWITEELVAIANKYSQGRIVSVLEGGYNTAARTASPFARSVAAHVRALAMTPSCKTLDASMLPPLTDHAAILLYTLCRTEDENAFSKHSQSILPDTGAIFLSEQRQLLQQMDSAPRPPQVIEQQPYEGDRELTTKTFVEDVGTSGADDINLVNKISAEDKEDVQAFSKPTSVNDPKLQNSSSAITNPAEGQKNQPENEISDDITPQKQQCELDEETFERPTKRRRLAAQRASEWWAEHQKQKADQGENDLKEEVNQ